MSYLDVPRFHFSGAFRANPSTVNNILLNYRPAVSHPRPSWNPRGDGTFQFMNCVVRSAVDDTGRVIDKLGASPIVGAKVVSTNAPVAAKIVDLDPEQQLVSELYGLEIMVEVSDNNFVVGSFQPTCFKDIWRTRMQGSGSDDSSASAVYQSVLQNVSWGSQLDPFLEALRAASPDPARLSIKFVVDRYNLQRSSDEFTTGRVVGTVGIASGAEPANFVAGRLLRPPGDPETFGRPGRQPELWYGPAVVDRARERVVFDLGNSLPAAPEGQPDLDLGDLRAAIIGADDRPTLLGAVDVTQAGYEKTAGIQEFAAGGDALTAAETGRLAIVRVAADGGTTRLLAENRAASSLNATHFVYRLNPGETAEVALVATVFGRPAPAGERITLALDPSLLPAQAPARVGVPESALVAVIDGTETAFPATLTTDAAGRAGFSLRANDPGNPRQFIDGQVYAVKFAWQAEDDPTYQPDRNAFLSILVFDGFTADPTWQNIRPIMAQYAKLYPFMNGLLSLDDPDVLRQRAFALNRVFNFPLNDPRYMPVTRDLSRDKKAAILAWLGQGAPTV